MAGKGIERAFREDPVLKSALNTYRGFVVHKTLADSMGHVYTNVDEVMIS
jgi:alanine dehydrogenase